MIKWETDITKIDVGSYGKVRLTQEGRTGERVWYEVVEVLEDYFFKVKLMNQPFNIDLKWGDIIRIRDNDVNTVPEYEVIK